MTEEKTEKTFVIQPDVLGADQMAELIVINELFHNNHDLFSVQTTRFIQDYMPNSVLPENFGAYVVARDCARLTPLRAFALCNRDFDTLSSLSTHKGWINRYDYLRGMEFYEQFIKFYGGYYKQVAESPAYKEKLTLTFDTSVLSAAELITLTTLHEASQRRNQHVFIIVNELDVSYPVAEAVFDFYVLGKRWAEIARLQDRSADSIRARASQLKATYAAKFWEAVEKARKSYLESRMGEMKAQAKLIKMD